MFVTNIINLTDPAYQLLLKTLNQKLDHSTGYSSKSGYIIILRNKVCLINKK